jgi:hypothetical protein
MMGYKTTKRQIKLRLANEIKGEPTDSELNAVDDKFMSPGWVNLLDAAGLDFRERQIIGWALRMAPRYRKQIKEFKP